jgi:hypothetical protein
MRIISKKAFDCLNYPDEVSREMIGNYYCAHLVRQGRCPFSLSNDCNICQPYLQEIENNLEGAESRVAIVLWRLKEFAVGRSSVWVNEQKRSPKRLDEFGLPTSDERNPFHQLTNQLGGRDEVKTAAG